VRDGRHSKELTGKAALITVRFAVKVRLQNRRVNKGRASCCPLTIRRLENATEHFFAWYTIGVEMMRAGEIVIATDTARFCKL
jgi:hypothetical protein